MCKSSEVIAGVGPRRSPAQEPLAGAPGPRAECHWPGPREAAVDLRVAMQQIMTAKVGIFRRGKDLEQAVEQLQALLVRSRNIGVRYRAAGANPELVAAYRTQKMLKLALTVAYGALVRTESRGAHFRETTRAATMPNGSSARWPAGTASRTRCQPLPTRRST
jgi:aspartate oxidase